MQAAVREHLHLRGIIRNNLPGSSDTSYITQQMLPGALHSTLRDQVAQMVSTGGNRACRTHRPADARALQGGMVAPQLFVFNRNGILGVAAKPGAFSRGEVEARQALDPVTASASAVACLDGTTVRYSRLQLLLYKLWYSRWSP